MKYKYNKVLILGFAKSGYEVAKILVNKDCQVIINDSKELDQIEQDKYNELKDKVTFVLGSHPDNLLDSSFDLLIKNPGVDIFHKYVLKAKELGIDVVNEVEVAYDLIPKDKNIKIIGITGTNGKTTTTTLIYEMLKQDNFPVHLAGNIGFPLCSIIPKLQPNDIIVMEVSSQQLENLHYFNPDISIITNISEAHLEFFKTYDYYKEVKKRIFRNQTKENLCIINKDDLEINNFKKEITTNIKEFSTTSNASCYLLDNKIIYDDETIIETKNIKIRGIHNIYNIMASIIAVKELGCSNLSITKVLTSFNGVKHRLEFVRSVNNILYYNDTEATNIKCTKIALSSFTEPTILILGGYERGQDFKELIPYFKNVKAIIAIGETRNRVKKDLDNTNIDIYVYETLNEGFNKIKKIAKANDVVLLSPASASWDQYNRCEERGDEFISLVNELNVF